MVEHQPNVANDPSNVTPANVSSDKLRAMLDASDETMQSIFRHDRKAMLASVVSHTHDLLEAESVAFFLVSEETPSELVLEASYSDKNGYDFDPETVRPVKIQSVPGYSFIGHIADTGQIVRLHGDELTANPYIADHRVPYLRSGISLSTLVIPLKDRKDRMLGLVKADNKKKAGDPNTIIPFTDGDQAIAGIFANKITIAIENLRTFETLRSIMAAMDSGGDLNQVLNVILKKGLALLHADRGDFVLWSAATGKLVIAAEHGGSRFKLGDEAPKLSIVRSVWESDNQESRLIPLISDETRSLDYCEANFNTRSELVVRVEHDGRSIGLLNAESFKENGFDEQDLEIANLIAQYAAIAVQGVGKESQFRGIVQRMVGQSPSREEILTSILHSVKDIYGIESGLIFYADYEQQVLRGAAKIGCNVSDETLRNFAYEFDEDSLAMKVFNERNGYFCAVAQTDAKTNKRGIQTFGIKGSLVCVPLVFQDQTVGTMAVWSPNGPPPTEEHIRRLEPFAQLAAADIAMWESERQRAGAMHAIQRIMHELHNDLSWPEFLRLIFHAMHAAGFERARYYTFQEKERKFVCENSFDMDAQREPVIDQLQGKEIDVDQNPYAKRTVEEALSNPVARLFDPNDWSLFGPDPDAEKLGKTADLPWVAVPIVVDGELHGKFEVDNLLSRRQITEESLEYLTLLASVASQAIARTKTSERKSADSWALLCAYDATKNTEVEVVRRLLVFLTSRETYGFSRALFLKPDDDAKLLTFADGVGPITGERFAQTAPVSAEQGIEWLLNHSQEFDDADLLQAMEDFSVNMDETSLGFSLIEETAHRFYSLGPLPAWVEELMSRINANQLFVVPVRAESEVLGMLVVDRQWQKRRMGEDDRAGLAMFAQQAAAMLRQHDLQQQVVQFQNAEALAFLAKGLTHQLRGPLGILDKDYATFQDAVAMEDFETALSCTARIGRAVNGLRETVNALESLLRPGQPLMPTDIGEFVREVEILCRHKVEERGIMFEVSVADGLPFVTASASLLSNALVNLIQNAQEALGPMDKPDRKIAVRVRNDRGSVVFEVQDNGPGMPANVVDRIRRKGQAYTTKSDKGLGLGLGIVSRIATAHGGRFDLQSTLGRGTMATLRIPKNRG